jgi:hypothetical protein
MYASHPLLMTCAHRGTVDLVSWCAAMLLLGECATAIQLKHLTDEWGRYTSQQGSKSHVPGVSCGPQNESDLQTMEFQTQ